MGLYHFYHSIRYYELDVDKCNPHERPFVIGLKRLLGVALGIQNICKSKAMLRVEFQTHVLP